MVSVIDLIDWASRQLLDVLDLRSNEDKDLTEDVDNQVRAVDLALDICLPRVIVGSDLAQGVTKSKHGSAKGMQPNHLEAVIATSIFIQHGQANDNTSRESLQRYTRQKDSTYKHW